MSDCLFCRMVQGEIRPDVVYEDDDILAFRDINPQAPCHILIIPKRHIATLNDLDGEEDERLVGKIIMTARRLAADTGVAEAGYRTVFNCNRAAGQEVYHIHLHLLAGRSLGWPPG